MLIDVHGEEQKVFSIPMATAVFCTFCNVGQQPFGVTRAFLYL
jgi:hypothetical protein